MALTVEVLVGRKAAKYLERLNEPIKSRIIDAIKGLSAEPPQGDIITMSGSHNMHRPRIGGYRALFKIRGNKVFVTNIASRGQAYK